MVFPVQPGDIEQCDLFGALCLAGAGVGAAAESLFIHLGYHGFDALFGLRPALRQQRIL